MATRFVRCEFKNRSDAVITVAYVPCRLLRFFGVKPKEIKYVGSGTVWHRLPEFKRAGTFTESSLSDFYERACWQRDGLIGR